MFDWIGEIIFSAIFEGIFAIIAQALSIERATNCAVKPSQTEHWLLTSAMTALVAATFALMTAIMAGATPRGATIVAFATAMLTLPSVAFLTRPRRRPPTSPSTLPR